MWIKKVNSAITALNDKTERFQFLTGNSIKLIAILSMVIDHTCKIVLQWLLSNYWGVLVDTGQLSWERFQQIDNLIRFRLQSLGAVAFPLFCFLLTEGFRYTRNRFRYIGIMLLFAVLSEIPFDIGFFSEYSRREGTFPFYLSYQNVFFTLFLGLITLECLERLSGKTGSKTKQLISVILKVLSVVVIAAVAEWLRCDYGMMGIAFIVSFYLCPNHRIYQILLFLAAYMLTTGNQPPYGILLSCLIILFYNGKRGKIKLKYFFYGFYPVHIILLYLITVVLGKVLAV